MTNVTLHDERERLKGMFLCNSISDKKITGSTANAHVNMMKLCTVILMYCFLNKPIKKMVTGGFILLY